MVIKNFIILPIIGMLIGFTTNWLAIKLLFWPKKKILGIQGVIPKRKNKIAEKIAESSLKFLPSKIEKLTKVPYIGQKMINYIKKEIAKKVNQMENKQIQEIIEKAAKKELKFIEFSGAVLGFIVGLIQALIFQFI